MSGKQTLIKTAVHFTKGHGAPLIETRIYLKEIGSKGPRKVSTPKKKIARKLLAQLIKRKQII